MEHDLVTTLIKLVLTITGAANSLKYRQRF